MDDRINELSKKIKNRNFSVHQDGNIHVTETTGEVSRRAGWWLYEAKLGCEHSSSCSVDELSELICLLLNREIE